VSQVIRFSERQTREAFRAAVAAADGRPVTFRDRTYTPQEVVWWLKYLAEHYREDS